MQPAKESKASGWSGDREHLRNKHASTHFCYQKRSDANTKKLEQCRGEPISLLPAGRGLTGQCEGGSPPTLALKCSGAARKVEARSVVFKRL